MGCDIHAAIEYRDEQGWHTLMLPNKYFGRWSGEPEKSGRVDIDRDYDLFAILGNVRNGSGFAGCDTGDGFVPMSDARGIPADVCPETASEEYDEENGHKGVLSHEHSATWLTLAEILAYDWTRTTKERGWVNAVQFEEWDRLKLYNPWPKS